MSYQVIARKWRPQGFEDVVGQEPITKTLRNAILHDRLHHAYLFSGARGVGKTTTARILAKALNCHRSDKPTAEPCDTSKPGACVSCIEISESRSIDVLEFDAASHTKVEEIRDIILESININPARDRFKIFIIDEVHMLSNSSFNALLKTLEEPPERVVFVMATTELHKVPDTIISRCQQFTFKTIAIRKIENRLKEIAAAENTSVSDAALREIARSGEGSMRDAQSNFDQVISFSGDRIETEDVVNALGIASAENLSRTVKAIGAKDSSEILQVIDDLVERGQDLRNYCRDILALIRDLTVRKLSPDTDTLLDSSVLSKADLDLLAEPFREQDLIRIFNSIAETESKLRETPDPRYILEIGLIRLTEIQNLAALEEMAEQILRLSNTSQNLVVERTEPIPTVDLEEKKTLKIRRAPRDTPFPVDTIVPTPEEANSLPVESEETKPIASAEAKLNLPESGSQLEEPDYLRDRFEAREAPEASDNELEKTSNSEDEQSVSRDDFDAARLAFDPEKMPIRLEMIASEELEHFEHPKLDTEFDERLFREDDSAWFIDDPHTIVNTLFRRENSSAVANSNGNKNEAKPANDSRALEIVRQMLQADDIPKEIPDFPSDPTEEALREYALKHPRVIKLMRLFRADLGAISQEKS